jgi:hypothetical protein
VAVTVGVLSLPFQHTSTMPISLASQPTCQRIGSESEIVDKGHDDDPRGAKRRMQLEWKCNARTCRPKQKTDGTSYPIRHDLTFIPARTLMKVLLLMVSM